MRKEKVRTYQKKYRKKNKERISIQKKAYCQEHREELKQKAKEYNSHPAVKRHRQEYLKDYVQILENKLRIKEYQKKYREKNIEKKRKYNREYRQRPKVQAYIKSQKYKERRNNWMRKRKKTNLSFAIGMRIRRLIHHAFTRFTKTGKVLPSKKYGIDYKAIIEHLKPFPKDTSKYHIDHIKPLISFKLTNKDGTPNVLEIKKAFSPSNHQWLTKEENWRKGGKY